MEKHLLDALDLLAEDYVITKEDYAAIKNAAETDFMPSADELSNYDSILADELWYNKGIIKLIEAKLKAGTDDEKLLGELASAKDNIKEKIDNYESWQMVISAKKAMV